MKQFPSLLWQRVSHPGPISPAFLEAVQCELDSAGHDVCLIDRQGWPTYLELTKQIPGQCTIVWIYCGNEKSGISRLCQLGDETQETLCMDCLIAAPNSINIIAEAAVRILNFDPNMFPDEVIRISSQLPELLDDMTN